MQIGQTAKLLDETGEVTIIGVIGPKHFLVVDVHGFECVRHRSELIPIDKDDPFTQDRLENEGHLKVRSKDASEKRARSVPPANKPRNRHTERQVDLHDHALPSKYHRMVQLTKLERALACFEDALWDAENSSAHRLLINHGIGEGILREEVRKILQARGYSFQDESYNNPGTTVVYLKQRL